jgi:uncharacterized protein YecT (DUF1311 family)
MTRFILLFSLFAALLAGCTSAKDVAQHNEERCLARGHQPKTDAYQNCIAQLENERDTRMETRRRELLEQSAAPPSNRGY